MRRRLIALLPLLVASTTPLAAQQSRAPFTIQETGQGFQTIDEADAAIRMDQRGTILIAPGIYHQCTIQSGGHVTFKAITPGTVIFEGTACEDKAAFVLRGQGAVVDGIVFRKIAVGDGNGAGIRSEIGDLEVRNSMFIDNQEGILGGIANGQKIVIDHSTFAGLGQCDITPSCSHSIYLANLGSVTVTHSRFERGTGGHYLKLRTPHVTITDNSFDDSKGSKTNYMIDLSQGATGLIARNTFVQGPHKENHSGLIVVSAEARTYRAAGLRIEDNAATLAPGAPTNPAFIANMSGEQLAVGANRLGPGIRLYEVRSRPTVTLSPCRLPRQ